MIASKSRLAMILSQLKTFEDPSLKDEQYPTDGDTAADVVWNANFLDDIEGRTIADLGAGTGILGFGTLLLGAQRVFLVEQDEKALEIAKNNYNAIKEQCTGEAVFVHDDVANFNQHVDVVIQNPPFGTKEKHADREFLRKAFSLAPVVYSFHKETTGEFLKKFSADNNFKMTHHWRYDFPIKASELFHKRKIRRINVGCWRFERKQVGDF